MALAGFRALLLQAVHPVVMAGFNDNTVWFDDMWGRLQRTGDWVGTVTYGTTAEAEKAGRILRRIHAALPPGVEPESGLPYRVDDPELLRWVHVTEVESFLSTYRRCGGLLRPGDADRYVDEMRTSAELVGLERHTVPATEAEIEDYYDYVRPQLRVSKVAQAEHAQVPAPADAALGAPRDAGPARVGRDGRARHRHAPAVGTPALRPARPADDRPAGHGQRLRGAPRARDAAAGDHRQPRVRAGAAADPLPAGLARLSRAGRRLRRR